MITTSSIGFYFLVALMLGLGMVLGGKLGNLISSGIGMLARASWYIIAEIPFTTMVAADTIKALVKKYISLKKRSPLHARGANDEVSVIR